MTDSVFERCPLIAALVAFLLTPIAPLCADLPKFARWPRVILIWIPVCVAVVGPVGALIAPPYSVKAPERVNIRYWEDADSGNAQWVVVPASGRLPEPIRVAANLSRAERGPFPWEPGAVFVAPAPNLRLAAPTFTILESSEIGGEQSYRALIRSERGAPEAMVLFPAGSMISSLRVRDCSMPANALRLETYTGGWAMVRIAAMPTEGVDIRFTLPRGRSVQVYIVDATYGLPAAGGFLLNSRPLTATPSQDGDVEIVSRRVELNP